MNEDTFNLEIRKFLKRVSINAQRDIEKEAGLVLGCVASECNTAALCLALTQWTGSEPVIIRLTEY